jgi:phage/plasmid primase-like uncharacterized protein
LTSTKEAEQEGNEHQYERLASIANRQEVLAMPQGSTREECAVDGVKYVINVSKKSNGWQGTWVCEQCGTSGGHNRLLGSAKDAIHFAKINLQSHHVKTHKQKKPPVGK